jgi:AcrR family transcriptional regulator
MLLSEIIALSENIIYSLAMATRREAYTEQTRRALLDSARECFAEHGFHRASVAEIAAGANVSAGAVYKHFESKEELFHEVAEELQRELFEEIAKRLSLLRDPLDRLREARVAYLDACDRQDLQRIVCVDYGAVLGEEQWRKKRPSYTVVILRELLGALEAEGRLRLGGVEAAAHMIFGAINEGSRWLASAKPRRRARQQINEFLELLEAALIR